MNDRSNDLLSDDEINCIQARMKDPGVTRMAIELRRMRSVYDTIWESLNNMQESMADDPDFLHKFSDNAVYSESSDLLDRMYGWCNKKSRLTREGGRLGEDA